MKNNITHFTGLTRLDIEPDKILEGAKGKLECVLIIGNNGYYASSTADKAKINLMLDQFKFDLLSGKFG